MADNSINPETQAKLAALERSLTGLEGRLEKATAGVESAATKVKTATAEVESTTRQKLAAPEAETALTPEVAKKSTAAADELAAAQRRATAAVEERVALEQRELALTDQIAVAQARQSEAIAAKAAADRQLPVARADYRQAVAKGTPAETEAAAQAQNDAKQQAQAANRNLSAANKLATSREQELGVVQAQLDTARVTETTAVREAAQAEERIALGSRLQAALAARVAALKAAEASDVEAAAQAARRQPATPTPTPPPPPAPPPPPPPPPPPRPPAPPGPPGGPEGRYLGPGAAQLVAVEQRATAAVEERVALEQRELALVGDIAAAQARQTEAIAAKAAADRQVPVAQATYRQAVNQGTPAEAEAAARVQNDAKQQALAANRDLVAANKLVTSRQQQLGVLQAQLDTARQLETTTAREVAQADERVGLGGRLQAALAARTAALEAEGGLVAPPPGPSGRYLGPAAAQPVQPPGPAAPPTPPRTPIKASEAPTAAELKAQAQAQRDLEAQQRRSADATQRLATANALAGTSSRGLSAGMEAEARALSLTDQSLQKTNALHTDYLSALAKGQTTMRDFTSQMGLTIGKFAGWTGAAAAVYGVIGAVQQLGRGAVEGLSGVSNLQRTVTGLNTHEASNQLIGLSHDTVTSLKDAGDAVFLFSRTFHNQNDAFYAAGLALRAYKLDGVSLTDQVKAMTAIHQQFKLSATELGPVMGLLAQGQREYNARVSEMIPLLTPSVSAIKNAGGDLNEFIKVAQLALRTTQLSGPRLGTVFARSPGFAQSATSQSTFAAFGIDPKLAFTNITELYREVLRKAVTATGPERKQLSEALFGKLLGARTAGLLASSPDIQNKILGQNVTSAQPLLEEFSKYLALPKTQLEALGVGLENMGARLANSGLLTGLGVVVHLLQLTLDTTNAVLKVFDELPSPIKDAVGALAALKVGTAVASKLNVGSNLGGNAPGTPTFTGALFPKSTARGQFTKALDEEESYYRDLASSSAKSSLVLRRDILTSQQVLARYEQIGASEAAIADEKNTQAQLVIRQNRAIIAEGIAQSEITKVTEANAAGRKLIAEGAGLEEAAIRTERTQVLGYQRPGPPGVRPTPVPVAPGVAPAPVPVAPVVAPASTRPLGGTLLGPAAAATDAQAAALARNQASERELSASLGRLDAAARAATQSTLAAGEEEKAVGAALVALAGASDAELASLAQLREEQAAVGAGFARAGVAARAGAAGTAAATAATRALGTALGFARSLLNPWTVALIGVPLVIGEVNSELKKLDDATKEFNASLKEPPSLSSFQRTAAALKKKADTETSFLGHAAQDLKNAGSSIGDLFKALDKIDLGDIQIGPKPLIPAGGGGGGGGGGGLGDLNYVKKLAEDPKLLRGLVDRLKFLERVGDPGQIDQFSAKLSQEIATEIATAKKNASQVASGSKNSDQLTRNINALKSQAESSPYLKVLQAFHPEAARAALKAIDNEIYQIWFQRNQLLLASQRPGGRPLTELQRIIRQGQTGASGTTQQLSDLQGLTDHIKLYGGSTDELKRAAELYVVITAEFAKSHDPKDLAKVTSAQSAFLDAIQTHVQSLEDDANAVVVPSVKAAGLAAHLAALKKKQALLGKARALLKSETAVVGQVVDQFGKDIGATEANFIGAEDSLDAINNAVQDGLSQLLHTLGNRPGKARSAAGKGIAQAAKDAVKDHNAKVGQAKAAQNASDALDAQLKSLDDSLSKKQGTAANAAAAPGAGSDPFGNERLRREIAKAQSQDPVAQAKSDVTLARREIAIAKTEHDRLQGRLDLVNAENELSQALQGVAASRATLAASETNDPVGKARAQLAGATQAAAAAVKQGAAAENAALASENDARAQLASDIEAAVQSRYALAEAQTNDPVGKARAQEAGANQAVGDAQRRGLGEAAINAARASAASAADAAAQAIEANTQSRYALAASATQDPVKQALINFAGATQAAADAERRGLGAAAVNDALAKENSARQALAQAYESAAQARFQLAESRTTDPVKRAQIEYNAATEAVGRAIKTREGSAAINTAKAAQNNARQSLREQRVQASEDTIQFELEYGKIGTQTAINEYEALLRVHKLTTAKRREILLAIRNLQNQSSSDNILNLGTIKLPSAYEVKRAVLGTQQSPAVNVTQHFSTTIQGNDVRQMASAWEGYTRATGKSVSRAIGQR